MCACSYACQQVCHSGIHLSGIGLSGYREAFLKAHFLSDLLIYFSYSILVSLKEFHKACLCTGCSFTAEKHHAVQDIA